jgi:hypothetical protein
LGILTILFLFASLSTPLAGLLTRSPPKYALSHWVTLADTRLCTHMQRLDALSQLVQLLRHGWRGGLASGDFTHKEKMKRSLVKSAVSSSMS